jgi:hypothetical protein
MSGSATVFADNAGVIGLLASILVWISAYTTLSGANVCCGSSRDLRALNSDFDR